MLNRRLSRFHLLLLIELLVVLMLLPGCFRRERLVYEASGAELLQTAAPVEGGVQCQGKLAELSHGVYQVRVSRRDDASGSLYVEVQGSGGGFRSLLGNGVAVFGGEGYTDFEVYVTAKIPDARVQCNIYDGGEAPDTLAVYRLNLGSRMLLFLALLCFAVLDGLLLWRRRILEGKVSRAQQFVFWSLAGTVLLAYFPYLTDYFYGGADTFFHITRMEALKESLQSGCPLPVRVQSYWLFGHGYAVSLFYGDLFLLLPAMLRLLGFPLSFSYRFFVLAIIAATAAIAYISLVKCVKDRYAALFGTVLYTLIPYRVFDIYNRGAIGECLAMAFMPLVCCAMYLLLTEEPDAPGYRRHKWYLIAGMSALLQCHLISTELAVVFMALACVVCWRRVFRRQTFRELCKATGIVLLINCWFWLPMLYMMVSDNYKVTKIVSESIQERGAYLAGMFQLVPNKGAYQEKMFHCEPVQLGAAAMLCFLVYTGFILWKGKKMHREEKCFAGLTLFTLILSLKYIPWDALLKVPVLGQIAATMQFPTRLMMLSTVFFAMFAALLYKRLQAEGSRMFLRVSVFFISAVAVGSCVYHVNDIAFVTEPIYLYTAENMGTVSVVNGEYLLGEMDPEDFYGHGPVAGQGLFWQDYERQGTEVTISLRNEAKGQTYLELPLLGYKGYVIDAAEGEGAVPYVTQERGAHGDLRIAVPGGFQGTIRVWYKGFALFRAAEAVSGVSIVLLTGCGLWKRRRNRGC